MPTENEYAINAAYWNATASPVFTYMENLHLNSLVEVSEVTVPVEIILDGMPNNSYIEFSFGTQGAELSTQIEAVPPIPVGIVLTGIVGIEKSTNSLYAYSKSSNGEKTPLITVHTSNYDITERDECVLCDTTAGEITLRLPPPNLASGSRLTIKKVNNSENAVIVIPNNSEFIDGKAQVMLGEDTFTFADDENVSYEFVSDLTNWYIVQ